MKTMTQRSFIFLTVLLMLTLLLVFTVSCGNEQTSTSADSTSGITTSGDTTGTDTTGTVYPPESSSSTADSSTTTPTTSEEPTVTTDDVTPPTPDIVLEDIDDSNGLLWYEFEEGDGATVLYSSLSQERDSILFSGSMESTGGIDDSGYAIFKEGDGIKLNNTFNDFGQIHDGTFLHPATQAISVGFYVIPDSISGVQMLFEYGSQYRGFAIGIDGGSLAVSITAGDSPDADGAMIQLDPIELPDSITEEWTHILFTYDGTLDGGTVTVYINFNQVASESGVGAYLPKVLDASGVATTEHGSNSLLWNDAYYNGKMDELRIYKVGFTPLPALEANALFLQSAANKNHYLKATATSLTCASMVEPAFRAVMIEKGLADAIGTSFRFSGTENYLTVKDGKLTVAPITNDADKAAATFYAETPLALPSWGQADSESFRSFRSMSENRYLSAKDGEILLTSPSSEAEKLSATFKLTEDQTKVLDNIRGAVYYPSYALNAPQFWKWYDGEIIERDMQYAKNLGINAFRIWVSYEYYLENPHHFKTSYDHFLSLAEQYEIKVMVSLFEGCGLAEEGYDSANVWSRDYTKAWSITSPSREIYTNPNRWDEPKAFVTWFFATYGNDERHMAIEIYNEPWGNRENLAKYLSEYAVTLQGSVPITFGTAPAGGYNVVYSVAEGADMIHYHDNFPSSVAAFEANAKNRINQGRLANLPVYCTEVQWVGGPSSINYPLYKNLAPTVNKLMETKVWASFYWTLMVHPCYLDSYRNNFKMKNGIIQEDGSYYSIDNAHAIAPEADLSEAIENPHNPYDDKSYTYQYRFSDTFSDKSAYKWTVTDGVWSAKTEAYVGSGITVANATDFADFTATLSVTPTKEASMIFRMQDGSNYYLAAVSVGKLTLYKVENGVKTTLSSNNVEYEGGAITLTVSAKGSDLRVSANCTDCLATDTSFARGTVGLAANKDATFDALSISYLAD